MDEETEAQGGPLTPDSSSPEPEPRFNLHLERDLSFAGCNGELPCWPSLCWPGGWCQPVGLSGPGVELNLFPGETL